MSDLINRQDAIDEAEEWIETYSSGRGGQRERDAIKHVISGIKKLPSVQQWIPCSERLPKPSEHTDDMVLVCTSDGKVRFGSCWYIRCICEGWVGDMPVVAWMPLPEPYEPQERSE